MQISHLLFHIFTALFLSLFALASPAFLSRYRLAPKLNAESLSPSPRPLCLTPTARNLRCISTQCSLNNFNGKDEPAEEFSFDTVQELIKYQTNFPKWFLVPSSQDYFANPACSAISEWEWKKFAQLAKVPKSSNDIQAKIALINEIWDIRDKIDNQVARILSLEFDMMNVLEDLITKSAEWGLMYNPKLYDYISKILLLHHIFWPDETARLHALMLKIARIPASESQFEEFAELVAFTCPRDIEPENQDLNMLRLSVFTLFMDAVTVSMSDPSYCANQMKLAIWMLRGLHFSNIKPAWKLFEKRKYLIWKVKDYVDKNVILEIPLEATDYSSDTPKPMIVSKFIKDQA